MDSDLYTGVQPLDGGAFGNEGEPLELREQREEQITQATKLLPSVDVIREIIQARRLQVKDFASYLEALPPDAEGQTIKDEYRARQLHLTFLDELLADISNRVANFEEQSK